MLAMHFPGFRVAGVEHTDLRSQATRWLLRPRRRQHGIGATVRQTTASDRHQLHLIKISGVRHCSQSNRCRPIAEDSGGYQYSRYCRLCREWQERTADPSLNLDHKAGEEMMMEWAGQTMQIIDRETAELLRA